MMRFSDIHSHFVYGIDDGAQTRADMEAMLDAAWKDGVAELTATPHVTPGVYAFDEALFSAHLEEARQYCRRRGYAMRLHAGAENLYTPALRRYAEEQRLTTIGDSRCVLLEFSPSIAYGEIAEAVSLLERCGYTPVLAHVERYRALRDFRLRRLREETSALFQINCATILPGSALQARMRAWRWLRAGLIDCVATDSHDCGRRASRLMQAYALLAKRCGADDAARLTGGLPDAARSGDQGEDERESAR